MTSFYVVPIPQTHMFDIFEGDGWENWSRVLVKYGQVKNLKGNFIPVKILYEIAEGADLFSTEILVKR